MLLFPQPARPEMVSQLKRRGFQHLAEALESLDQHGTDPRTLVRIELYLKKLLLHLDKSLYRKCSAHYVWTCPDLMDTPKSAKVSA